MRQVVVTAMLGSAVVVSCADSDDSLRCGEGTVAVNGVCQVAVGTGDEAASGGTGGSLSSGGLGGNGGSGGKEGMTVSNSSGGTSSHGGGAGGGGGEASSSGTTASATTGSGGTGGDSTSASGGAGGAGSGGMSTGGTGGNSGISTEPFDCGSRDVTGAKQISGPIVEDTTWSGLIHVTGDVSVRNEATLTIEPGTKVIVGLGNEIDFGWENSRPLLLAKGTPESPILFCGETDSPGYWKSLTFQANVDPKSVLRNVLIQEAGATGARAALVLDAPVLLEGVQVVDSGWVGVQASTFSPDSRVLSIHDSAQEAGQIISPRAGNWPDELDLSGNRVDEILITFTTLSESIHLEAKGYGFRPFNTLSLAEGSEELTFRLAAGTTFSSGLSATDLSEANVLVEGTEEDPAALLRGVTVGKGIIRHAVVGVSGGGLELVGPTTLQNVTFDELDLSGEGAFTAESKGIRSLDGSSELTISSNGCTAVGTIPRDTKLAKEATIWMYCLPMNDLSVPNVGGEYVFDLSTIGSGSQLNIEAGTVARYGIILITADGTLTIERGVQLKGALLMVNGELSAEGTAEAPVLFLPQGTEWSGIEVAEGATLVLDHAVIDAAGHGTNEAAVYLAGPATITNTTIINSGGWGLLHAVDDSTDYSTTNIYTGNALGDIGAF